MAHKFEEWAAAEVDPTRAHDQNQYERTGRSSRGGPLARLGMTLADRVDMATVARIGCPWCLGFGSWAMHTSGIPREKIEAVPHWRDIEVFDSPERLVMAYAGAGDGDAAHRRR